MGGEGRGTEKAGIAVSAQVSHTHTHTDTDTPPTYQLVEEGGGINLGTQGDVDLQGARRSKCQF